MLRLYTVAVERCQVCMVGWYKIQTKQWKSISL